MTTHVRVLGVCGSISRRSANHDALVAARDQAPEGVALHVFEHLGELPPFNPDIEVDGAAPPVVRDWRATLAAHHAVLFASPEYGHSLPGVLKNALDWTVGSGELDEKPVAMTCIVPAASRGALGRAALREVLVAVNARIVFDGPTVRGDGALALLVSMLEQLRDAVRG